MARPRSSRRIVGHLRDAVALLRTKATPQECEEYKSFILKLAERVASAHKESGAADADPERAAIDSIGEALG